MIYNDITIYDIIKYGLFCIVMYFIGYLIMYIIIVSSIINNCHGSNCL